MGLFGSNLNGMTQDEIRQLADAISVDLYDALVFYEVFHPSGSDAELIRRVNELRVPGAFNAISASLQLSVIAALCRNWDKTSGTARIPEVAAALRRYPMLVVDQARLAEWLANVQAVETSEELEVLRAFRNVGLSHRENPNRPNSRALGNIRRVQEGDEGRLLRATIPIVDELHELIGYSPIGVSFCDLSPRWQQRAREFWQTVAT
jgi:hypothetical protein